MEMMKIAVIGLGVALVLTFQYFIIQDWFENQEELLLESYMGGYEQGMSDTMISLFEKTQDCKLTTLIVNNFSRQILDIQCLQPQKIGEVP